MTRPRTCTGLGHLKTTGPSVRTWWAVIKTFPRSSLVTCRLGIALLFWTYRRTAKNSCTRKPSSNWRGSRRFHEFFAARLGHPAGRSSPGCIRADPGARETYLHAGGTDEQSAGPGFAESWL